MDAPDQLLLGEGICRQLEVIRYHPDVLHTEKRGQQPMLGEQGVQKDVPEPSGKQEDNQADQIQPKRSKQDRPEEQKANNGGHEESDVVPNTSGTDQGRTVTNGGRHRRCRSQKINVQKDCTLTTSGAERAGQEDNSHLRNTETTGEKTVLQNPTTEPSAISGDSADRVTHTGTQEDNSVTDQPPLDNTGVAVVPQYAEGATQTEPRLQTLRKKMQ